MLGSNEIRTCRPGLALLVATVAGLCAASSPAQTTTVAPPAIIELPQRLAGPPVESVPLPSAEPFARLGETPLTDPPLLPTPRYGANAYRADDYADWTPQLLPDGLIYRSYLAGVKESRLATNFDYLDDFGWIWDITLGGRVGLFRFGSSDPVRPEGFQIDVEGSGQPRLNLEHDEDLIAADFRAGLPVTYGIGPWQTKLAYYHLSSHLGDEYMLANPGFRRVNYARDALVLGQSYYVTPDLRLYGEFDWAFYSDISEPWAFQFGVDYSPLAFNGARGAPFIALNGHLRQELNFSGNFVAQAGWQWRGLGRGRLLRIGAQYYNGLSNQYQLYNFFENKLGVGVWYDY